MIYDYNYNYMIYDYNHMELSRSTLSTIESIHDKFYLTICNNKN